MVEWLERGENEISPSDLEVWHLEKTFYSFKDLNIWKQNGTLNADYQKQLLAKRRKEKGKSKARQNERREKDRYIDEVEDVMGKAPAARKQKKVSGTGKTSGSSSKASGSKSHGRK